MRLKVILYIVLAFILSNCVTGYFCYKEGFKNTNSKVQTNTRYLPGDSIRDTLRVPHYIEVPGKDVIYPQKHDTIWKDSISYIHSSIDTSAVISDWSKVRYYNEEIFDIDTVGKMNLSWENQYNKTFNLTYSFVPYQKVIQKKTDTSPQKFRVMGGIGTNNYGTLQGMYKINSFVIGGQYLYNFNSKSSDGLLLVGFDF